MKDHGDLVAGNTESIGELEQFRGHVAAYRKAFIPMAEKLMGNGFAVTKVSQQVFGTSERIMQAVLIALLRMQQSPAHIVGQVRQSSESIQAAKEIQGLIGASVERVEAGSRLMADAGATMTEIVSSVQRVSDIIGEITSAASEQSDGIGLVNTTVTQLDQMTQQNAALVEQSAAAAESLKEQAARLAQVVSVFRLETR
jgi:methyl-accepting chemotaxis protein